MPSMFFVLLPILAAVLFQVAMSLDMNYSLPLNAVTRQDNRCRLMASDWAKGSEDIVHLQGGIFLSGISDILGVMEGHGSPGEIMLIDVSRTLTDLGPKNGGKTPQDLLGSATVTNLTRENYPSEYQFHPHGLHYSNDTQRLYVVNHDTNTDRIDIFDVVFPMIGIRPSKLVYKKSIESPLFPALALNSVTEVGNDEVYITQWLPFGMPGGKHANLQNRIRHALNNLFLLVPRLLSLTHGTTGVLHCKSNQCSKVLNNFISANGITISENKERLYVVDSLAKKVYSYNRGKTTGSLTGEKAHKLPASADNVRLDAPTGELHFGIQHSLMKTLKHMDDHISPVPGSLVSATLDPQTGDIASLKEVCVHDGSLLPFISSGHRYGSTILLGSPDGPGFLICSCPHTDSCR